MVIEKGELRWRRRRIAGVLHYTCQLNLIKLGEEGAVQSGKQKETLELRNGSVLGLTCIQ